MQKHLLILLVCFVGGLISYPIDWAFYSVFSDYEYTSFDAFAWTLFLLHIPSIIVGYLFVIITLPRGWLKDHTLTVFVLGLLVTAALSAIVAVALQFIVPDASFNTMTDQAFYAAVMRAFLMVFKNTFLVLLWLPIVLFGLRRVGVLDTDPG